MFNEIGYKISTLTKSQKYLNDLGSVFNLQNHSFGKVKIFYIIVLQKGMNNHPKKIISKHKLAF